MSDTHHLLIPFATTTSEGCQQALQALALPHLDRLLARLSPLPFLDTSGEESSFSAPPERALARSQGLPQADGRIPLAAWHRQQQGLPLHGDAWAFVTPCQWQVSTDHIVLREPQDLGLDEADSQALLALVAPWFAEDGITLEYEQPTRWIARGPLLAALETASLDRVAQRDVQAWMPRSDDAQARRTLHRLHSEIQMLLYTHPLTEARAERGLPAINAFWVHGAGPVLTTNTAAASGNGAVAHPIIATDLRAPALNEDWRRWAAAWQVLDAGPVAELLRRAEAGTPVQLTLCGERHSRSFQNAAPSLRQRIQRLFKPQSFKALGLSL